MKRIAALALALGLSTACTTLAPVTPAKASWVGVWGASPAPPPATAKSFENETIRQVVRLSASGKQIRIRFTNEYGDLPLVIGAASVVRAGADGATLGAPLTVTFSGASSVTIPRRSPLLSDPIDLPVDALDSIAISIFLPSATGLCTCHPLATATSTVSPKGDFTRTAFAPESSFINRAFISGVDVVPSASAKGVIVTLGDSITDGYLSTNDGDKRWPDILANRLEARSPGWSVVNHGISGNRLLAYQREIFGDPALARFDRDVLSVPGLTHITVLEGINDIGMGADTRPTPAQMIGAYQQLITRAHAKGIKIYGATLTPYQGAAYYSDAGEVIRQAVNTWIRTSGAFDAVIDFDLATRDPANPAKFLPAYHAGDWLHPNDAGYAAMANAVDLGLFN